MGLSVTFGNLLCCLVYSLTTLLSAFPLSCSIPCISKTSSSGLRYHCGITRRAGVLKKEQLGSETAGCALHFLAIPCHSNNLLLLGSLCEYRLQEPAQFSAALETHCQSQSASWNPQEQGCYTETSQISCRCRKGGVDVFLFCLLLVRNMVMSRLRALFFFLLEYLYSGSFSHS